MLAQEIIRIKRDGRTLDRAQIDSFVKGLVHTGGTLDKLGCIPGLFRFQIDRRLGAKPQTVLLHGKAKQRHILLIWKWNYNATPDVATLHHALQTAGCAIIGQTTELAPADCRLYAIRDVTATVARVGFTQFAQLGQQVQAGGPLAVVHAADAAAAEHAQRALQTLVQIGDAPIALGPVMVQRVVARAGMH